MKNRESSFELLRILAMLMIISGHLASEGGVLDSSGGYNHSFVLAISSGARIAVNLFLMLGCWFMVDAKYSTKRILRLYSTVWFYSALLTLIVIILGYDDGITLREKIISFFPFVFRTIWYATIYIILLLLAPYLRRLLELEKRKLRNLVLILFLFISGISTISGFNDTFLCALSWFVFIFLFIGYYKMSIINRLGKRRKGWFLIAGIALYALAVGIRVIAYNNELPFVALLDKAVSVWLVDYKSIPNFLCSLLIFTYFAKLDIGKKRVINFLASGAFAAYIIHQVPTFKYVLWYKIFRTDVWGGAFIIRYLTTVLVFYLCANAFDYLRSSILEKQWLNCGPITRLCRFLDVKSGFI